MNKRWRIHPHDSARNEALAREVGVSSLVAQVLICRGLCDASRAREFLDAKLTSLRDPELLPGVTGAADHVHNAVKEGRKIVIYGDYDVDGMTATAVLWRCLKLLGAEVSYHVPHRIDDGYGLSADALTSLAGRGAQLVITVDCGVTAIEEARTARELGLDLVITDHHELAAQLPDATAIVHPSLPGSDYPFSGLSGSGVAFKLAWAIAQRASQAKKVSPRMKQFLMEAVGLAAMGTIADVVPLVDENRVLALRGLQCLKTHQSTGLAALMKVAGLDSKRELESEDVGFALAPRLNAVGRLGQAQLAVELLTTESEARATELAQYIDELNRSRQSLERSIYLAATKQAQQQFDAQNDAALVLADRGWHAGVIGIVAGRLAEKYHRPVVMIALDDLGTKPGIGSARSVPGFSLHKALESCSHHLVSHGGHAAAAGLKIEESKLEGFRADFCEYAHTEIGDEQGAAELWIDAETPLSALTMEAVGQIQQLAPFGHGNSRPVLCATGVTLAEPPRKIGGGGRHLALRFAQHGVGLRGVAFGRGEEADELSGISAPLALAFRPIINDFRGRRSVELHVADWQPA